MAPSVNWLVYAPFYILFFLVLLRLHLLTQDLFPSVHVHLPCLAGVPTERKAGNEGVMSA